MNTSKITAFSIIAIIGGLLSAVVISTSPVSAAAPRCVSEMAKDGSILVRTCADKDLPGAKEIIRDYKAECKATDNKCSSSQTAFGEFSKPN